jgi:putative DNA relaxase
MSNEKKKATLSLESKDGKPPASNTGAQTALVDWMGITFPLDFKLDDVYRFVGADGWVPLDKGGLGYKQSHLRGNVRIFMDGSETMGIHIEATGKGCRELEADGYVTDWPMYFKTVLEAGAHFSRLDVAIDEKNGLISMDTVEACTKSGCVVSRYRQSDVHESYNLEDGSSCGKSVYFGSPSSDTRIRIYDKAKQLNEVGKWIRVELQTRRDKAQVLASSIAFTGSLEIFSGYLRGLLDFKVKGNHSQKERWDTQTWWDFFLNGAAKIRLTIAPMVRSLEKSYAWVIKQVAPTFAMIVAAYNGDLSIVDELIKEGIPRWRPWHKALAHLSIY